MADNPNPLPDNWKLTTFGKMADFLNGYAFAPDDWKEDGLPIIRIEQLRNENAKADYYDKPLQERFRIRNGDLIFSWSASLLIRIWDRGDAYLNQHLFKVENHFDVDRAFLKHLLDFNIDAMASETHGSTMKHITRPALLNYQVEAPIDTAEQRTIADILSALDEAIAQSESLVRKYQFIKQGLMSDLLTRGVDENGELRDHNPVIYKTSEFGKIPKEWDIATCSSVCSEIIVGIVIRPAQYYVSEGIPTLRSKNIKQNGIDGSDFVFISEKSNQLLAKSMLRKGNVVTVRTGEPGTSCVIPDDYDGVNCIDLIISRPKSTIDSAFLALWINSPFGRNQVLQGQGGLAQQHFNVGHLKKLKLALPSFDEQVRITTMLNTQEQMIEQEKAFVEKLILLKQGLMQDLLSGQVRVSI